jgi:ribosomal protein S18 acetylase RimI-like enzyme
MKADSEPDPLCSYLEWDSTFFERRIARLNRPRLDEATLAGSQEWCNHNRIDCLYFLADSDHAQTPRLAAGNDFLLTDVRVSLARSLVGEKEKACADQDIRLAREEDLTLLRSIAKSVHRDTRFYFDPHFEPAKCDLLYQTWIENSLRGFAQAVWIAECDGQAAAYLTGHFQGKESRIGLLGVSQTHRGKGLATRLIQQFLSWSREQDALQATVVTQGRNVAAQRLYQRNGFLTESLRLWYHRWFAR